MNYQEHIDRLLEKFSNKTCTPEELQELYNWLDKQAAAGESYSFANENARLLLKRRMRDAVLGAVNPNPPVKTIYRRRRIKYAAAAAIIGIFGAIVYWQTRPYQVVIAAAPGKVVKQLLPDGSTVWLNDNSTISYYSNFARRRTIELKKGEAFFEVKKDPAFPFTVLSNGVSTTVKGTSFSVKMINRTGDIKVSVVTGKVLVHQQKDTLGYLVPGVRLRYIKQQGKAFTDSIQTGEANAWIQGEQFLQNATLDEVIQWLQGHFNVQVNNRRADVKGDYYLQVRRDITLQEVIDILNLLGAKDHIQFSIHNETVFIQ